MRVTSREGVPVDAGSVVFDRHRLERRIGQGGMGEVWLATDLLLEQPVALKRISLAGVDDEQAELVRNRALREGRVAAQLRHHRHVVATYDVHVDDGDVWLVLDYLPSRSLAQILRESGTMDPGQVARIGAQVADALAAAHALGIEHRDVTPGNVLISDDGIAWLTDFGISRLAGDARLTQSGVLSGTFAYLAPEVARTGKSSPAADVFSLGSTLYAAIEGRPPFGVANNVVGQLNAVSTGIIVPPTAAGEFEPLLMLLLGPDPADRPDAATARDLLEQFATQGHAPLLLPASSRPGARWWRGRWTLRAAIAVVIVAVVAVSALLWPRGGGDQAYLGTPALPSTVGPIALTGDARAADPCALIDLKWLRQFGRPFITIDVYMESCSAGIGTTYGVAVLSVFFDTPVSSVANLGGRPQQFGDLTIVRQGARQHELGAYCQNVLVLADRTRIYINAAGAGLDLCRIAEVSTVNAVNLLARDGITYRPGRVSRWSLAASDACMVLHPVALRAVTGLDSTIRSPGFANWSCTWGASTTGSPQVSLSFRLDSDKVPSGYGDLTTVAGHRAWLRVTAGGNNPQQCTAVVVHRPAPSATAPTEMIEVEVDAAGSREELCARATELATAVEATLPAP